MLSKSFAKLHTNREKATQDEKEQFFSFFSDGEWKRKWSVDAAGSDRMLCITMKKSQTMEMRGEDE